MIDRTIFDLRLADHTSSIASINQSDWQHGQATRRPLRAAFANALLSLATRLDPTSIATRQPATATSATPA